MRKSDTFFLSTGPHFNSYLSVTGMVLKTFSTSCQSNSGLASAKLVKKNEKVLVVGSGIGPYPLVLAKHSKAKEITGIEINPSAHKYAEKNVKQNKITKIKLVKGDIRKAKLGKFDRIILAVPHEGSKLVPYVIKNTKKGTRLHVLDFAPEDNLKIAAKKLKEACKKCKVLRTVKAGQHAVRKYRVCVDAKIF